jgi:hypothetical protein
MRQIIFAKSSLVSRGGLEALALDRQFAWLALEDVERGMAQEREVGGAALIFTKENLPKFEQTLLNHFR